MPASEWPTTGALYDIPEGYERRMQILEAINDLLKENSVEEINISMICKQANISRPTFYRYFTDKYNAINWYHYVYARRFLYQVGRTMTWHEATVIMFQHVVEERTFYERAFGQVESNEDLKHFNDQVNVENQLETIKLNGIELTDELEYEVRFWARSVNVAIAAWIKSGFPWTPEQFAHFLDHCRPSGLQHAMDEPVLRRRQQIV